MAQTKGTNQIFARERHFLATPVSFEKVVEIIQSGNPDALKLLGRSDQDSLEYRRKRVQMLQEYSSVSDVVKINIMGYDYFVNEGKLRAIHVTQDMFADSLKVAIDREPTGPKFVANDFPYYFEEGVEHYLIWNESELIAEEIDQIIAQNLGGYESCWFRNPPPLRTIPDLWHVHVVSRPRS